MAHITNQSRPLSTYCRRAMFARSHMRRWLGPHEDACDMLLGVSLAKRPTSVASACYYWQDFHKRRHSKSLS